MTSRHRGATALLSILLLAQACGPARSTEAFCATLQSEKEQFLNKYDQRADQIEESGLDGFGQAITGLASGIESLGDAAVIFRKLADVAPEEIRADVEVIRDSMDPQRQAEQAKDVFSNPLGTLASGVMTGLMSAGSWQRVESFIETNC